MLLLHAAVEILQLNLVVHALLHLIGDHVESLPVVGLQEHCDIVLGKRHRQMGKGGVG